MVGHVPPKAAPPPPAGYAMGRNISPPLSMQQPSIDLAEEVQKLGLGYSRMEQCIVDLVHEIRGLVLQNAALIQAMAERDERESPDEETFPQSLSNKRRG